MASIGANGLHINLKNPLHGGLRVLKTSPEKGAATTGLAISDLSKSVPYLFLYHETVPEVTSQAPLDSQNSRACINPMTMESGCLARS